MVQPDRPDDNITWCTCFACWVTKALETHSGYVIMPSHGNNGYANMPQCYVICALPIFIYMKQESLPEDEGSALFSSNGKNKAHYKVSKPKRQP
jgi:hypothetical protein